MNNRNHCASVIAFDSCGCQDGTEALTTPLARNNRPGLPALSYRIGTHASFLETMKARLSSNAFPELKNLTARDSSDPSIALLDAWAIVADVLTFYQERIANEGYIRTATEERSIQELARLVGAGQRSGVAATVPLAYTIDPNTKGEVVIPAGSRVQSVPGQNEKPQTFETSEDLKAYAELNMLKPRMSKAQRTIIYEKNDKKEDIPVLYLKGVHTNLKQDDRLLIIVKSLINQELYRVVDIKPDFLANRTYIALINEDRYPKNIKVIAVNLLKDKSKLIPCRDMVLIKNKIKVVIYLKGLFENLRRNDIVLISTNTAGHENKYHIIAVNLNKSVNCTQIILLQEENKVIEKIYAFRTKTAPFGHNAPLKPFGMSDDKVMRYVEWQINNPTLNPDLPKKVEFIITIKKVIDDKTVQIEAENISTGYFNKVSWIKYTSIDDKVGEPLLLDIKPEQKEYRSYIIDKINIGEYLALKLTGLFSVEIEDRKIVIADQITPANFSVGKNSIFPEYTLICDNAIKNEAETEEFIITDISGSKTGLTTTSLNEKNKKIKFADDKEGVYFIERKIKDTSGKLSNCLKFIRAYKKPVASFQEKFVSLENNIVTFEFTNTSTGKIDTTRWYFNNEEEPIDAAIIKHSYKIDVPYNAELVVTGPGGEARTGNIALNITFFTIEGALKKDQEINFSNKSTGSIQKQEWFFGDGKRSKDKDGKNIYTSSGKYTVTLLVTRSQGETEQYTDFVDIID